MHKKMDLTRGLVFSTLAAICLFSNLASADDWPFFRGPNYNGVSAETGWNAKFGSSPKVAWKKNVGKGASGFVVVGNRAITMGNRNNEDVVSCFNPDDGSELWAFKYPCRFASRSFEGGTASTPTVDGESVYTLSYDGQINCIKLSDGKSVWKKNAVREYSGKPPSWKYAGSPLVMGNLVIFDIGGSGNSTLALDKATGKKVWGSGSEQAGYATPIPFKIGKSRGVLVFKGKQLIALNAANGQKLWSMDWITSYNVNASSPTVTDNQFFVSSGYGGGRGALFPLTSKLPQPLWTNRGIKTKMSSCAIYQDHVYGVSEQGGRLMCMSMKKGGQTVWKERGFGGGTMMIAGGKLVVLSSTGELVIAEASPAGFKPLSRARVLGGRCWVNPVLANGRIYCKNNKGDLVCLDVRK